MCYLYSKDSASESDMAVTIAISFELGNINPFFTIFVAILSGC